MNIHAMLADLFKILFFIWAMTSLLAVSGIVMKKWSGGYRLDFSNKELVVGAIKLSVLVLIINVLLLIGKFIYQ